jgi:flagellar biosynthesis protein FlhF
MAIKRYVAATTREAMMQVRRELGDDAVILSSKRIGNRLEILAAASDAVEALVEASEKRPARTEAPEARPRETPRPKVESFQDYLRRQSQADPGRAAPAKAHAAEVAMYENVAHIDDEQEAPATAREAVEPKSRAQREPAAGAPRAVAEPVARAPLGAVSPTVPKVPTHRAPQIEAVPNASQPAVFRRRPAVVAPVAQPALEPMPAAAAQRPADPNAAPAVPARAAPPVEAAPVAAPPPAPIDPIAMATRPASARQVPESIPFELTLPAAAKPANAEPAAHAQLLTELQSMRTLLQQQLAALAGADAATREAPQTRALTRLVTAGFSVEVARRIAAHATAAVAANLDGWLQEVLAVNVKCAAAGEGIVERAGGAGGQVYALVGPTGVGKTTTVAKLAARFAVKHGTSALGLITLDAYRVAAPEQLRTYGRILGTPVHLAQDAATLRELLATMAHKRLVLIDTCGLSQRDQRLPELLDLLASASTAARPIARVLLANAASHAETLDEAARAWRAHECAGAILTKLDEAVRIGGALDVALRHRLTLLGLTNGQRVPEDWHPANGKLLAHLALKPASQLFELAPEEVAALAQHA